MSNPSQAFWRFYDVGPNDYVVGDAPVYPELYNVYVVYNDVSGMNTDGTYIIRYEWSGGATVDADNPGTWEEWKYVRSDGGDERHTYVRGYEGFGEDVVPAICGIELIQWFELTGIHVGTNQFLTSMSLP